MKNLIYLACLMLIFTGCTDETEILKFQIDKGPLSLIVNKEPIISGWEITSESKLENYEIECSQKSNMVTLKNEKDSINFNLSLNDTIDFKIIQNKKDTVITRLIGVEPNINFTDKYMAEHTGKVTVEIPEVSELSNILIALHKDANRDKNMTDSDTEYYRNVKEYFAPYMNHPMMDTIHKYIGGLRAVTETDTIFSNESYMYYVTFKMNACAYHFDSNGKIVNDGFVKEMAKGWHSFDPMKDADLMADFVEKSNYRAFYKQNKPYYDGLITTYNKLNPISKMQNWLDAKFEFSYGNYAVYFSPLVSGAHSAQNFKKDDFNQSLMFIARAEYNDDYSSAMNELLEGRVLFTEIDHNYVNPISDKYLNEINEIYDDRELWAVGAGTEIYDTPYMVFNEYMTFAIYSLFANDNFNEKDLLEFLPKMESQMKERGFPRFKDFNRELLKKYKEDKYLQIDKLFEHMFEWSKNIES